ncbi:MAG: hypothetical protein IJA94_06670 [Bacilli bacterium]|nr:hypothetical protein [Bacilli bacterium]MBQ3415289.1 hypothetical protein [Clostridia bacterium]MBQ6631555.1 hypothetical protein [Romboutsia sp.]MBR0058193.1 hypothetical protein [Methanobrevibacter sp.]MBQ4584554.1 hypothetical protein [Bacilli bacterium]
MLADTKTLAELSRDKVNLDALIHLIIDNADLSYSKNDLRISNETTIVQFIKYVNPKLYNEKLEELKKED